MNVFFGCLLLLVSSNAFAGDAVVSLQAGIDKVGSGGGAAIGGGASIGYAQEISQKQALWLVTPEAAAYWHQGTTSQVTFMAGGRLAGAVWGQKDKQSKRSKRKVRGRDAYTNLIDVGPYAHVGVGALAASTSQFSSPRLAMDGGAFADFTTKKLGITFGLQVQETVLLANSSTPQDTILTGGLHVG